MLRNVGVLEPYVRRAYKYRHPVSGEIQTARKTGDLRLILSPNMRGQLRTLARGAE